MIVTEVTFAWGDVILQAVAARVVYIFVQGDALRCVLSRQTMTRK